MDRRDCGQVRRARVPSPTNPWQVWLFEERSPVTWLKRRFHAFNSNISSIDVARRHYQLTKMNRSLQLLLNRDRRFS